MKIFRSPPIGDFNITKQTAQFAVRLVRKKEKVE